MSTWSTVGLGNASYLEIGWTTVAFVMMVVGINSIRYSINDILKLKAAQINSLVSAVAKDNLITTMVRTLIQVTFFTIGVLHMIVPPRTGDFSEIARVGIAAAIYITQILVISAIYSSIQTRRYLIEEIEKEMKD